MITVAGAHRRSRSALVTGVVAMVTLTGCGAEVPSGSPTPTAILSASTPLPVGTASPAPVARYTFPPGAFSPTPAPSPGPARAALRVALTYTPASTTIVLEDQPNLLLLAEGTPSFTLAVGVPYGYPSEAAILRLFRTERFTGDAADAGLVSAWCPGMADPHRVAVAGMSGPGFFCDGDAPIDFRPLYPITARGREGRQPAGDELFDPNLDKGWLVLSKGDNAATVVLEVEGKPVVVTVIDGEASGGPGRHTFLAGVETAIKALHLTWR